MSKVQKLILKSKDIHLMKSVELEACSQLMTDRFIQDPCTLLQLDTLEKNRARELFFAQCKGQLFAFGEKNAVYVLNDNGGILIGYSNRDLPNWKLVNVVMLAGKFVRQTLKKPESEILRENAEYVKKINPGAWHTEYVKGEYFHILAIAIDKDLKGTGAFRKIITPILDACQEAQIPITMEIHNDKNTGIYEHFGFEVKKVVEDELVDVRCTCLIRFPK